MFIGVPKESKDKEYRVAITPDGTRALRQAGHQVLIQATAGEESGFADEEYRDAGATIVAEPEAEEKLTRILMDKRVTAITYETVEQPDSNLALLIPL